MERIWMKKPNRFFYYRSRESKQLHHNVGDDAGKGIFIFWSCIKLQLFWDNILLIFEHVFVYS